MKYNDCGKILSTWIKDCCPFCESVNWVKEINSKYSVCCYKCNKLFWIAEFHKITFNGVWGDRIEDGCQYGLDFPRD